MESDQLFVDACLDRAVEEFNHNPLSSKVIRRLAQEHPESFGSAALRHLAGSSQSTASRLLGSILLREKCLFERLSDPGVAARQRAVSVFNKLIGIDPALDIRMAKMLPDRSGTNHKIAMAGARGARTIEILDICSTGGRLVPFLAHLSDSEDPLLCTRATLFLGRRIQSPEWAERQLKRQDERIRANVIESMWGMDTPFARTLLNRCLTDPSNRVAGNCLVGLYLLKQPGVYDEVCDMAVAGNYQLRATAAWAMGRMGNPGFVIPLSSLVKDEHDKVRGIALRSLIAVRRLEANAVAPVPTEISNGQTSAVVPEEVVPEDAAEDKDEEVGTFELRLDGSSFHTSRRVSGVN